jgi:PBP1b-binding outer membrane lipoprotein LpoB
MKNFKIAAATTLVMITLSGCVSQKAPTTSDFMRMHALDEKAASVD